MALSLTPKPRGDHISGVFTVGNHIAFGPNEYNPDSAAGQQLIAHEVVHTLQQPDAEMSMMPKADLDVEIDPDPKAEREADAIAGEVMKGGEVGMTKSWQTDVHVQRSKLGAVTSTMKNAVGLDEDANIGEIIEQKVEEKLDQASTAASNTADRAQQFGQSVADGGRRGLNAIKNGRAASVATSLTKASTKGALGSVAGFAAGKLVGAQGGAMLGATLGAAAGTMLGPLGTAAGAEAGRRIGETAGKKMVGGAVSDVTKEATEYTMPQQADKQVKQLKAQLDDLRNKVNSLANEQGMTGTDSQGLV